MSKPGQSKQQPTAPDERRVVDQLPSSFDVMTDESQWLLTLLGADDLRQIFEGKNGGEGES